MARLALLTIAAAGFLAMHGLAATDQAGRHHSPLTMPASSTIDPALAAGHGAHAPAPGPVTMASAHEGGCDDCHHMAAACMFILLGLIAIGALHALHGGLGGAGPTALRAIWPRRSPARSPPQPVFLLLCVFRL